MQNILLSNTNDNNNSLLSIITFKNKLTMNIFEFIIVYPNNITNIIDILMSLEENFEIVENYKIISENEFDDFILKQNRNICQEENLNNYKLLFITDADNIYDMQYLIDYDFDIFVGKTINQFKYDYIIPLLSNTYIYHIVDCIENIFYGRIPKIMNFYWDSSSMSYLHFLCIRTFIDNNQDWLVRLYTPIAQSKTISKWDKIELESFQFVDYCGHNYFNEDIMQKIGVKIKYFDFIKLKINNQLPEIIKSELCKYYILATTGGFWSNMNILFIKPMIEINFVESNIISGKFPDLDIIISYNKNKQSPYNFYYMDFLGASRRNKFFLELFELAITKIDNIDHQSINENIIESLFDIPSNIIDKYPNLNIYNLHEHSFHKYWGGNLTDINEESVSYNFYLNDKHDKHDKDHFGYHWFDKNYFSQIYINNLGKKNKINNYDFNGSIPLFVEKYMKDDDFYFNDMSEKFISIVMAYYNRREQLIITLKTIQLSKHRNYEIIIVDDNSSLEHKIDDLPNIFPDMNITVVNIPKMNDVVNPCVVYNYGFNLAKGEIIIIQNPECCHIGDVMTHVNNNLNFNNYISYSCFYLSEFHQNKSLYKILDNVKTWDSIDNISLINKFTIKQKIYNVLSEKSQGWINHPILNPNGLHFCSAIYKENLLKIGGFSDIYKNGICFDDDDFLRKIKYGLKLNCKIIPTVNCDMPYMSYKHNIFVIHQCHDHFSYQNSDIQTKWKNNLHIFCNEHKILYTQYIKNLQQDNLWSSNIILNNKIIQLPDKSIIFVSNNGNIEIMLDILNFDDIKYSANGGEERFYENITEFINKYLFIIKFEIVGKISENDKIEFNYGTEKETIMLKTNSSNTIEMVLNPIDITNKFCFTFTSDESKLINFKNINIQLTDRIKPIEFEEKKWIYTKIPKILFTYWFGNLNYLNYLGIKQFIKLNPDWKVIIYIPKYPGTLDVTWKSGENAQLYVGKNWFPELEKLKLEIKKIDFNDIGFINDCNEIIKSDYMRLYYLSTHGGVWSDFDILYLKPMSHINFEGMYIHGDHTNLSTVISTYPLCCDNGESYYSIGFLMSCANNTFYRNLALKARIFVNTNQYQSIGSLLFKKIYPHVTDIPTAHPEYGLVNIGLDIVYPFKWDDTDLIFNKNVSFDIFSNIPFEFEKGWPYKRHNNLPSDPNRIIGIHWFEGSMHSKKFVNKEDYDSDVTVNNIIKKYISQR